MEHAGVLRAIRDEDIDDVLRLNHDHVDLLSPLDAGRLAELRGWATRADVIVCDGQTAGFVLVFRHGTAYDSDNYRWFHDRFDSFDYLDRIVIDDRFRRRGLGSAVYDEVEAAASRFGRLTLEVNVDPPNRPSLAFHESRGFRELGQRGEPGHRVSLMAKELSR